MARVKLYPSERLTGYEQLLSYYPVYYREVFEMEAILKYFGELCDLLEEQTEQAYLNYFILEADEETVKTWENLFGIQYSERRTLDERRRVILARFNNLHHIGEPEIRSTIRVFGDNEVWIDFDAGIIYILIQGDIFDDEKLFETLSAKIPAHLKLDVKFEIHKQFRQEHKFKFMSNINADYDVEPVSTPRSSKQEIKIGMLAVEPETFVSDKSKGSGEYVQSHVKSKLIK